MAVRVIEVAPFDLVVFGGTGDLAHRKLLPALYHRDLDGQIPDHARIIGCARRAMDENEYRAWAEAAVREHVHTIDDAVLDRFLGRVCYVAVDAASETGRDRLTALLSERPEVVRAFYLAVSPDFFGAICKRIGAGGLVTDLSRVVIEKPIGKDGASAKAVNAAVGQVFREDQIFRIDHYLGKETV